MIQNDLNLICEQYAENLALLGTLASSDEVASKMLNLQSALAAKCRLLEEDWLYFTNIDIESHGCELELAHQVIGDNVDFSTLCLLGALYSLSNNIQKYVELCRIYENLPNESKINLALPRRVSYSTLSSAVKDKRGEGGSNG